MRDRYVQLECGLLFYTVRMTIGAIDLHTMKMSCTVATGGGKICSRQGCGVLAGGLGGGGGARGTVVEMDLVGINTWARRVRLQFFYLNMEDHLSPHALQIRCDLQVWNELQVVWSCSLTVGSPPPPPSVIVPSCLCWPVKITANVVCHFVRQYSILFLHIPLSINLQSCSEFYQK